MKNQLYDALLIDARNLYDRNYYVNKALVTKAADGTELVTGGVYGALRSLRKLRRERLRSTGAVYVLVDATFPASQTEQPRWTNRSSLDPDYKANRVMKPLNFYVGFNAFISILRSYGPEIYIVGSQGYEADDLVKPVLEHLVRNKSALLVSTDTDWARCITDTVHWMRGSNDIIDSALFETEYGYSPSSIVLYKSLKGDSDNIPIGVPMLPNELAKIIVNRFSTVSDLLAGLKDLDVSDTWKKKIYENRARLMLNERLVNFWPISSDEFFSCVIKSFFEPLKLKVLYETLAFDIAQIDDRVLAATKPPETTVKPADFLRGQKISRSQ